MSQSEHILLSDESDDAGEHNPPVKKRREMTQTEYLIDEQLTSISTFYTDNTEPKDMVRKLIQSHLTDPAIMAGYWIPNEMLVFPRIRPCIRFFNLVSNIRRTIFSVDIVGREYEILLRTKLKENMNPSQTPSSPDNADSQIAKTVGFFKFCVTQAVVSNGLYTYLYKLTKQNRTKERVTFDSWTTDDAQFNSVINNPLFPYFEDTNDKLNNEVNNYQTYREQYKQDLIDMFNDPSAS